MAFSVQMPALGESVSEGTVTRWLKQEGDTVEVDEPLLEVSTDKVDTEIPSPAAGTISKIVAQEDDVVEIGGELAVIDDGEGGSDDSGSDDADEADEADDAADEAEEAPKAESKPKKKSGGSGEGQDVVMPELGESVTEGTVTRWLKSVGDTVEVDEPLLEVSTDKVDTEIPSPVAGTLLEILAEEDDTIDVGGKLAVIGDGDAAPADDEDDTDDSDDEAAKEEAAEAQEEIKKETPKKESKPKKKSGGSGEGQDVVMPELGESVTEGTVTRWLKSVGDTVEVDEPLLEVSTDKVDTEIPSPVAGTLLEILAEEDDTIDVGGKLAVIGDGDAAPADDEDDTDDSDDEAAKEEAEEKDEPKAEEKPKAESKPAPKSESKPKQEGKEPARPAAPAAAAKSGSAPYVTPLVRKIAEEKGVDLSTVTGTGVGGRIRKQDVLAAAEGEGSGKASAGAEKSAPKGGPSTKGVRPELAELRGTTQKANRIRKITAQRTREALQSTAQLTQVHEVDMTRVAQLRAQVKNDFQAKHGVKLTFLPFYAKAAVEALISHPNVNASYDEDANEITYHDEVHLGIAVDTEEGLLSPVIKNCEKMSIAELAKAIVDIADRARNKKLTPSDLSGGTFTITNIGSEGALFDTPILVPPQAAMLGTGAIVRRPIVDVDEDGEAIAIRSMGYLPLTYDHRLVDGADAGRFLTTIKDRLQTAEFEGDLGL